MSISIQLKKEGRRIVVPKGMTGQGLASELKLHGPDQALALEINDELFDLSTEIRENDLVDLLSFDDEDGKEVFWHSSAHILAQAVLRLWPNAKPTIGPPIENGFYYDFADLPITEGDLEKIEKEMVKIVEENYETKREVLENKQAAQKAFQNNPYKLELIRELPEGELITAYRQGEYYDLCRGPHIPKLGKVKALKVLKTAGAYWRGDPTKEMLTRIYAITFPDRTLLKAYLHRLEEAKKRDHKVLGPKLDLFSLKEEAPGMPFFHPKGLIIWNELLRFWREAHERAGYLEIKTPIMMSQELWKLSGHWDNYRENMYTTAIEERAYAIKPMNCPGAVLVYKSTHHSYRDFPLRLAEIGHVHRYEAHGALSGLMRVRAFHQDDAHIFLSMDQVEAEITAILDLVKEIYAPFGLEFAFALSTKPSSGTIGSDEDWHTATEALRSALEKNGFPFEINAGDGAFYGPKIDIRILDALGRKWQCSTVQLDMALPERFGIEYDTREGGRKRPLIIHRVIYGSIERFLGILIEHFAGKFPLWLSPRQVRMIPVADRHIAYAEELALALKKEGFHVEIDAASESVGKKIRLAQIEQVNYMLTLGDRESENRTISLRTRDNVVHGEMAFTSFVEALRNERSKRALSSPFHQKEAT